MEPRRVLVTGAAGQTGLIALRKMAGDLKSISVTGAVRTEESAKRVRELTGADVVVCDVTNPASAAAAMRGVDTVVILSSATPKPNMSKLLCFAVNKYVCCNKDGKMGQAFEYLPGGEPQKVDWEGGRNIIDAAKAAGVKHVVYVGSMGGTKPDHFLNQMGGGNILLWKRKAEMHLIASGLDYTIIHPGGLLPHAGTRKKAPGGERELVVGINDALMDKAPAERCIPREDVAEFVRQCVLSPDVCSHRSFDLVSKPPGAEGTTVFKDLEKLLGTLADGGRTLNCDYSSLNHEILKV